MSAPFVAALWSPLASAAAAPRVHAAAAAAAQEALGTIEFAVEAFGCHLVVVLGHERCAAVTIASSRVPVETIGAVHAVIDCVKPSIAAARARVRARHTARGSSTGVSTAY